MDKKLHDLLSSGKFFNVELKDGIIMQHVCVEYMSDNIILFVLKSGDYKVVNPSHVKKAQKI